MALTLYGISNCDTVRKARRWLDDNDVQYRFHDFRADGLDAALVHRWIEDKGWEQVLNRRSTSWKAMSVTQREGMDAESALACILEAPTLVKRPVLCGSAPSGAELLEFGFKEPQYKSLMKAD